MQLLYDICTPLKMEYAEMQIISESYDILKYVSGLSNLEIAEIFA